MRIRLATVLVAGLGLLLAAGGVQAQNPAQPCTENCIDVTVVSPEGEFSNGQTVTVPINFKQGPEGLNDQAAIAFTLEIPFLRLENCENPTADGLTSAFEIPGEISDLFRVVIENTSCPSESSKPCLCPGEGQTRANYINVVLFGPRVLPTPGSGTVDFPLLPADGNLLSVRLVVENPTVDPIPLHLFADTDNQAARPKPQFGALLSVGDNQAVDDTLNRTTNVSNVRTQDGQIDVIAQEGACACDCNGDMRVLGSEITRCVRILGNQLDLSTCPAADSDASGRVTGSDVTRGVIALGAGTNCVKYCNGEPCQQ